jgi:hypothetical protein
VMINIKQANACMVLGACTQGVDLLGRFCRLRCTSSRKNTLRGRRGTSIVSPGETRIHR